MRLLVFGVALLFALWVRPALAQSVQIGFIDGVRIENDTRRAYDISEMLRREFSAREQEVRSMEVRVKALQAQLPSVTQTRERELKEREFQTQAQRLEQIGRAFVDDVQRRKAEERRKYYVEVTAIVNKLAESQKLDLVVQEAVYAGKAVDLTEQVIKSLGGPAPKPAAK
jgi:outer membrane protein